MLEQLTQVSFSAVCLLYLTLLSLFTFCQLFVYFTETLTKFCEVHPKVWLVQGHTDCDNLPSEVQAQLIAVLNSPSK